MTVKSVLVTEDEGMADADVPPWYFTMIVPLTSVTQADGPTQFRLGTHKLPADRLGGAIPPSYARKTGVVVTLAQPKPKPVTTIGRVPAVT